MPHARRTEVVQRAPPQTALSRIEPTSLQRQRCASICMLSSDTSARTGAVELVLRRPCSSAVHTSSRPEASARAIAMSASLGKNTSVVHRTDAFLRPRPVSSRDLITLAAPSATPLGSRRISVSQNRSTSHPARSRSLVRSRSRSILRRIFAVQYSASVAFGQLLQASAELSAVPENAVAEHHNSATGEKTMSVYAPEENGRSPDNAIRVSKEPSAIGVRIGCLLGA